MLSRLPRTHQRVFSRLPNFVAPSTFSIRSFAAVSAPKGVASKETHPREWAIFSSIDTDCKGSISTADLVTMCKKMGAKEHIRNMVGLAGSTKSGTISFQEFCDTYGTEINKVRRDARLSRWSRTFGLGVAGNVAGHMAQAGEAEKDAAGAEAPKTPAAIFAFYVPLQHEEDAHGDIFGSLAGGDELFGSIVGAPEIIPREQRGSLGGAPERITDFPITNSVIEYPKHLDGAENVQVEPEIALYCDIVYTRDGERVERLAPRRIAAFNDCSIRKLDSSAKLSEKKNWGNASKGISFQSFRIRRFCPGSQVDRLVLTSYIKRGNDIHKYSTDAPARNYLLFHEPLLDWIVKQMNEQQNADKWEDILEQLRLADYPTSVWIALGAGEYTAWGEQNFLQVRDEVVVMIYDEIAFPRGPSKYDVEALFADREAPPGIIALHQTFV